VLHGTTSETTSETLAARIILATKIILFRLRRDV